MVGQTDSGNAQAAAPSGWGRLVGDRIDTEAATAMLRVTRDELATLQRSGSILGLTERKTSWFPAWQFDGRTIRHEARTIIGAFRDVAG